MAGYVFTVAEWDDPDTSHNTLRKYTEAGVLVWGANLYDADDGSAPDERAIAVDPDGHVYTVNTGVYIGGSTLVEIIKWKVDGSGYEWAVWHQGATWQLGVAVLPSGNVAYCSARGSDGAGGYRSLTLLDGSDGSELWHKDVGGPFLTHVCCDEDGNVYCCGHPDGVEAIWSFAESGAARWIIEQDEWVTCLAVDKSYLYAAISPDNNAYVRKFGLADGVEITGGGWPIDLGEWAVCGAIAVDQNGIIYIGYVDLLGVIRVGAYSAAGGQLWTNVFGDYAVTAVAVSPSGYVYACGDVDAYGVDASVRKYNKTTGVEITTGWPLTSETKVNAVTVSPGTYGAFPGPGGWLPAPSITVGDVLYE
jgi:hypothetical protein